MAKLTSNDIENLLADFNTGKFSQRDLSKKYNVSLGKINQLVKGLEPKNEHIVEATKTVLKAKEELTNAEMNSIMNIAEQELRNKEIIMKATLKNITSMIKKINDGSSIAEHKIAQDAIDKASITLNVNPRHANSQININNENNQATQNVASLTIEQAKEEAERLGVPLSALIN